MKYLWRSSGGERVKQVRTAEWKKQHKTKEKNGFRVRYTSTCKIGNTHAKQKKKRGVFMFHWN